jgi:hypothetical protein
LDVTEFDKRNYLVANTVDAKHKVHFNYTVTLLFVRDNVDIYRIIYVQVEIGFEMRSKFSNILSRFFIFFSLGLITKTTKLDVFVCPSSRFGRCSEGDRKEIILWLVGMSLVCYYEALAGI